VNYFSHYVYNVRMMNLNGEIHISYTIDAFEIVIYLEVFTNKQVYIVQPFSQITPHIDSNELKTSKAHTIPRNEIYTKL